MNHVSHDLELNSELEFHFFSHLEMMNFNFQDLLNVTSRDDTLKYNSRVSRERDWIRVQITASHYLSGTFT